MRESYIERKLIARCEEIGALCIKFPPIFLAGFPDRICLFKGGVIVFVELKAPNETPRKLQLRWHNKLRRLGFRVEVLDTVEAVNTFIESIW